MFRGEITPVKPIYFRPFRGVTTPFFQRKKDGVFQASFFRGRTGGDDISHIFSFFVRSKKATPKKPPGDSRPWHFLCPGWRSRTTLETVRVNSVYPQRGHPAELPESTTFFQPDLSGQTALILMAVFWEGLLKIIFFCMFKGMVYFLGC